jgi:hypothetical protein
MDEEQPSLPLVSSPLKEQQELQHQPTEETTIIDTSSFSTFSTSAEYQPIQRHVVHSNQSSLSNTSIEDYSMGRTSPLESKSNKQDSTFHFTNQTHFFDRNALFMYNTRVLLVLIACIIPFFSLTGKYSLALMATGLKIVYVLDFLEQKNYAFYAFWITMSLFWLAIYVSSLSLLWISALNVFVLFQASAFVFTFGIWGSLNFRFLRNKSPEVTLICERYLFAILPYISLPLLMTLIIGINGIQNAPFYLSLLMCTLLHMFHTPLKSSFKQESKMPLQHKEKLMIIQRAPECQLYCLFTLLAPCIMYLALYHRVLTFSFEHLLNLCMLLVIPAVFFALNPNRYLWWCWKEAEKLPFPDFFVRLACAALGLIIMITWLEYRVIFRRYTYLLAIPAPYNYIIVTFGLYSLIGLVLIVIAGVNNRTTKILSVAICTFSTACGSIAIGFPIWIVPIPAAAAYFGSAFFFSRSWEQFVAFGITLSLSLILWFAQSFWFLDFEFQLSFLPIEWSMRMSHTTVLIVIFFIICLFTFPACIKNNLPPLTLSLTMSQALLLTFLEQLLYEQGEGFYSEFLVLLTSAIGALLSIRLYNLQRLTIDGASILLAIYVAKISVMFSGTVRMAFISTLVATISFTYMYFATQSNYYIPKSMAWLYFIGSGAALFITRHFVIQFILQAFIDVRYYEITEKHLIGAVLFAWGIALLPLSLKYMKDVVLVKRVNIMVSIIGALWAFWQPSLETSIFEISPTAIFSDNTEWVSWLILFTIILTLVTTLDVLSLNRFAIVRALMLFSISIMVSICFCASFLLYSSLPAVIVICIASICAAGVEIATSRKIKGSYNAAFISYGLFIALLPIIYILIDSKQLLESASTAEDVVRNARIAILSLYSVVNILLSISIRFKLSVTSATVDEETKTISTGDVAFIGNVSATIGYVLAVSLTTWLGPDNIYLVYLALTTIFLLLNRDNQLLKEWNENYRYTLVTLLMQIAMFLFFIMDVISLFTEFHVVIAKNYAGVEEVKKETPIFMLVLKGLFHILLFFLSMPSHWMNLKFMYTLKRPNIKVCLLLCLPLSILTCALCDGQKFTSLYLWGGSGIAGSLLQAFVSAQFVRLDTLTGLLQ